MSLEEAFARFMLGAIGIGIVWVVVKALASGSAGETVGALMLIAVVGLVVREYLQDKS